MTSTIDSDPNASPLEDGPTTSFSHDASGHVLSLTDPVGNTTTWTFDDVGRVIEEVNELEDSRTWDYDNAGRLIEKIDRLGRSIQDVYNVRNWLTEEKWYDGESLVRTLTFDRDDAGRLTDASDPSATYAFALDDAGRVTSETQTLAALSFDIECASTFNDNGARTKLQAILDGTNDFRNTYTRDNISRVTRIDQEDVSGGNTLAEKRIDLAYNDYGNLRKIARYADIAATEFVANTFLDYDEFGRVIEIFHTMDSTAPEEGWGTDILAGYLVEWDAANRVTSIDFYIDGLSEFAYDNSDQLLDADHTSQSDEDYSFDDNGNRTMTGYTTGDNNQLTSDGRR